jgi:serine/threonine protein kinase/Flp pilus assembly protein TadD
MDEPQYADNADGTVAVIADPTQVAGGEAAAGRAPRLSSIVDIVALFGASGETGGAEADGPATAGEWLPDEIAAPNKRYDLRGLLGRGGMGIVHTAFDRALRRDVAYKVMRPRDGDSVAVAVTRFVHEAQVTAQLEHPNIVPVHELGRTVDGEPYFTMKQVRGETLKDRVWTAVSALKDEADPWAEFPLSERIDIVRKVLDALGIAHEAGVIHRDLKPDNIMVGRHGEVLVMDWGLARIIDAPPEARHADDSPIFGADEADPQPPPGSPVSPGTRDGTVLGTPGYMSPEQARGEVHTLDRRADIFSVGAIMYELLTLSPPYDDDVAVLAVRKATDADFEPLLNRARKKLAAHASRIPADLAAIAGKAMAQQPDDRYGSAAEMRRDLDAWVEARPTSARRGGLRERLVRWTRRHPATAVGATVAVVFAMLLAIVVTQWRVQAAEAAAERERLETERIQAQRDVIAAGRERERAEATAEKERIARLVEKERADREAAEALAARRAAESRMIARRDAAMTRWVQLWAAKEETGMSHAEFTEALGEERIRLFLSAYDRLIEELAPLTGLELTGDDYFFRGFIRSCLPDPDLDKVIEDHTAALKIDPTASYIYNDRGTIYHRMGRHEEAIRDFTESIERVDRPDRVDVLYDTYMNRSGAYLALKRVDEAVADLGEAIRLNDARGRAYAARAEIKRLAGDHPGAIADARAAVERNAELVTAWVQLALSAVATGRLEEAIEAFSEAIDRVPADPFLHYQRGRALAAVGGPAETIIADMTVAIDADETNVVALALRGNAHRDTGDLEHALADYDRAVDLAPHVAAIVSNRGDIRRRMGDDEGAAADFDTALGIDPNFWPALANRGALRAQSDDPARRDAGIAELRRAWRLCPIPEVRDEIAADLAAAGAAPPDSR